MELVNGISFRLLLHLSQANLFSALSLTKNMPTAERNIIAGKASFYVLIIILVVYYSDQVIMHSFDISIPDLSLSGDFIFALFGFRLLFPVTGNGGKSDAGGTVNTDIAFIPLAMPGTVGPCPGSVQLMWCVYAPAKP